MSTQSSSSEFKEQVIREVQDTQNAASMARRHHLSPGMVRRWARTVRQPARDVLSRRKCSIEALD